jgi:diguanylate cyclase (GGDEF)-like protein
MEGWEDALRDLRAEYVVGARAKAEDAVRLVAHLASDPFDRAALSELLHRFHGLAGSGTTYRFPRVSEIALAGERACDELLAASGPAPVEQLEGLRRRAEALVAELDPSFALEEAPAEAPAAVPPSPGAVLVVDPDGMLAAALRPLLEREGLPMEAAGSIADALAAASRRLPLGVLTALRLPDGSGHELARAVRRLEGGDVVPLVMLGGAAAFVDKVDAIHSGADAVFDAPVDAEKVVRRLQDLMDRRRDEAARVLCVEDDPSQAAFLRAVLRSAGYETSVCAEPRRFESAMAEFRPDLVLMDLRLPGVSGHDLVRYVRQEERYAPTPVILLTTDGDVAAEVDTLRAGADDHLVKPVPPRLLLSSVAARLERAHALKGRLDRDGVTRLLTHTAFLERARAAVARKDRDPERTPVWVMVDIDDFKRVNDRYGHPTGDRVIAALAAQLRRRVRPSDVVGRYGGEEFALILDDVAPPDAVRLAERLLAEFRALDFVAPGGAVFHATVSAGIATLAPGMGLDAWRQAADDALYAAKRAGRDRVELSGAGAAP